MGQKASKSNQHLVFNSNVISNLKAASSGSSGSSSSCCSQSKSNHESAISSDSGCYLTDRFSSPSGSSVLGLFEVPPSKPAAELTIRKRSCSKRFEKGDGEMRSKTLTRDMAPSHQVKVVGAKHLKSTKSTSSSGQTNDECHRFSFCDSLDYSYSLHSSSSSCLNLETIDENLSSPVASQLVESNKLLGHADHIDDYLHVAAHSLCDQLNQILNISAGLALDSVGFNKRQEFIDTLANASNAKSKNDSLLKKTLSSVESTSDLSETGNEKVVSSSSSSSSNQSSAKLKFINRSHTFHAEQSSRRSRLNSTKTSQRCQEKAKPKICATKNLKLVSTEDEIAELEKLDGYKATKTSNRTAKSFLLKNGRRLFTWNRKSNAAVAKKKNDFERVETPYLFNNVRANPAEEQLINLIAAKLMSENIELAQAPYSDEYGFCKIPIALVRRYALELKRSVELTAKCMETERLSQLEKSGKIGVSFTPGYFPPHNRKNIGFASVPVPSPSLNSTASHSKFDAVAVRYG